MWWEGIGSKWCAEKEVRKRRKNRLGKVYCSKCTKVPCVFFMPPPPGVHTYTHTHKFKTGFLLCTEKS
jgi:hypothetical protein